MPTVRVTTVMAAAGVAYPLQGSQYEYLPFNARVQFAIVSTTAGLAVTVYSGTDLLQQAGGPSVKAATVPPVYPDDFLLDDVARAGERISVELRETLGGTPTVQTCVIITPI